MSRADLEQWQRLAPLSLLFLVINGGIKFVRDNLYAFAGAGAGFAFLDELGLRELALGGLCALLVAVLLALVYYRRFRFRIDGDAMRVRSGLIEKKDLRVRFARVQNVGVSQPLYFRPFGLVRFTLETPGAELTEVALPGISRELAQDLRACIAEAGGGEGVRASEGEETENEDPGLIHKPSGKRLFAHGLVSNQVWLIAGLAAYVASQFWERVESWLGSVGVDELLRRVIEFGWVGGLAVVAFLVAFIFVLSGLLSWIRFQDFVLREQEGRLHSTGGFLDRREQTIRREKLTGLVLYQAALGRLIGQWYLVGKQASNQEFEIDPSGRHFLIPGLGREDLGVVGRLLPGFSVPDRFHPISPRFRSAFWIRISAAVLLPLIPLYAFVLDMHPILLAPPLALAFVLYLVHRRYRCWGWWEQEGVCWVQQGTFGLRRDAFRLDLVQQASVVCSPYQRRHDLASVKLVLPQGEVTIPYLPESTAVDLVNQAIYAAETAREHRV